jgi:uncharacterized protein
MLRFPTAGALRAAVAAIAVALLCGMAEAQQPSATAMAGAKELVTVKGAKAMYDPLVIGIIEKAKGVFLQTNPMLGKDLNEVAGKLRADLGPRSEELVNEMAKLYAARFTEQEIKDALTFYKSPLGRKLLAQEPAIADQSMRSAAGWADKLSDEVINRMRAEMRKRGHEI